MSLVNPGSMGPSSFHPFSYKSTSNKSNSKSYRISTRKAFLGSKLHHSRLQETAIPFSIFSASPKGKDGSRIYGRAKLSPILPSARNQVASRQFFPAARSFFSTKGGRQRQIHHRRWRNTLVFFTGATLAAQASCFGRSGYGVQRHTFPPIADGRGWSSRRRS